MSKDEEINVVSAAFRKQYRPPGDMTPWEERPRIRSTYDNFVLVTMDSQLYRVGYTMDAQHNVTFDSRDQWKKAELEVRTIESGIFPDFSSEASFMEGEQTRDVFGEHLPLIASLEEGKMEADIVIIEPGFGNPKDNHFYPSKLIKEKAHLFQGAKMFTTHDQGRDTNKFVANVIEAGKRFTPSGGAIAKVAVHDSLFWDNLKNLKEHGLLHTMHNSILATGVARKGVVNGKKANVVEDITKVKSVDFVPYAGAGGRVLALAEELRSGDVDVISYEEFVEKRPDIVTQIQESYKETDMPNDAQEVKELEEKLKKAESALKEAEESKTKLEGEVAEAKKTLATLQEEGEEHTQYRLKQDAVVYLEEANVGEDKKPILPTAAVTRIKSALEEGAFELEEGMDEEKTVKEVVDALIKEEQDYLKDLSPNGKVTGLGESFTEEDGGGWSDGDTGETDPKKVLEEEEKVLAEFGMIELAEEGDK